jgi:hypothetical protein
LLNAGIDAIYSYAGADIPNRWLENFILASRLFAEAEVKYDTIDPNSYPEES